MYKTVEIKSQEDFDAMFLSNDAHKLRYRELEVFISCLSSPGFVMSHCNILSNPGDGEDFANFVKGNREDVFCYLMRKNHKMKDKGGDWCCGGMGSRWADFELFRGVTVRLAFYSRKLDPKFFNSIKNLDGDYALMICQL
jgi:hypothetical protein